MDLIDNFLEQELERLNLDAEFLSETDDVKLNFFFNLFVDVERKYFAKIEDIKRFDQEHKNEISQLHDTIIQVKQLIEEREKLNTQLKSKIKNLETELENTQYELEVCLKNQASTHNISSSDTSEDLSEATIEMLILEGFGKIVGAPTHEKIAVILADRHRLQEELSALKNTVPFSQELEEFNCHQTELETLRQQVVELNKKINEDESGGSSNSDDLLKMENTKLKMDNQNLRSELEKLYDEIGIFESETKQLKEESKSFQTEIENLNNELDELIQYKLNYEHLKKEYDKLRNYLKQHEKLLNDKLSSPRVQSATIPQVKSEEKNLKTPKLELEWIRGENEKLLLDLEKTQTKLNDKISQYNELKSQIAQKDDEMKEFIKKYEQNETTKDDILLLQKKIINLENDLDSEKDDHQKSIELGEERLKELLQRNDNLWSQLNNLDIIYQDSLSLIKKQNENILELEAEKKNLKDKNIELNEDLKTNTQTIKELNSTVKDQELIIKNFESSTINLKETNEKEKNSFEDHIKGLDKEIEILNEKISSFQKDEFNFKLEIESLNKEIKFIVSQNEQQNSKLMQDYLALQERYNKVSFEMEMINMANLEKNKIVSEKNDLATKLEAEKKSLNMKLEQEKMEKNQFYDRMKSLESINEKNWNKIGELNVTINRIEHENNKLEQKAKEFEILQSKFEHLINELDEERETLSKVLETKSKQEIEIGDLKSSLNDAKHELIKSNAVINELSHFKSGYNQKLDEIKSIKNECENEKSRREKLESKQDELKEEAKKLKQKLSLFQDEIAELKHENIDYRNQLAGYKSRLDMIVDKGHTEFEKNSALQDQLNELRKKLEHAEVKCSDYCKKFDLLMQKYEQRKTKQKNKIERLWDYLQKERSKYKDLLSNAQNKTANDQEISSYQLLVEERNNLVTSLADRDSKIRDLRRQNAQLNCKIKLLNNETENLNDRLEDLIKEKNKLRREIQLNALSTDIFDFKVPSSNSNSHLPPVKSNSPPILLVSKKKSFNSVENIDKTTKLWADMNTSYWDINYNTGNVNQYALATKNEANNYILNMTSDINSITNTPRSFR